VAKKATLHEVRILKNDGSGFISNFTKALDSIRAIKLENPSRKMVVNLSAGTTKVNTALNNAIANVTQAGVIFVAAAGNSNKSACLNSPGSALSAIVVASSDNMDKQATFTSWGSCVDIYAPGVSIMSLTHVPGQYRSTSGTSASAPHVAGAVALYLEAGYTADDLLNNATMNILLNVTAGTPNKFLYIPPDL
jgi:subtilisin family serine protease